MKKKILTSEFIFVFYVFGFAMIRPILFLFRARSSVVIFSFIAVALLSYLYNGRVFEKRCFIKWAIISIFFEVLLYFSPSEVSVTYMMNFFMYGVVTLFLLINVNDYKRVLFWVVVFSCINGILLILDPFFNYQFNGDYMEYGFNMLMFSFTGLLIGYFYYKNRYFLVPIVIELIMISFYGNKGASVTAILLFLGGMILSFSNIKRVVYSVVACVGILSWRTIVLWVIDLAKYFGVSSYSITTMKIMLSDDADIVFSTRTDVWETAQRWISEKPFFGYGIGAFEASTNGYVHNIFFDITLSFGFIGLIIFIILLLHSVYRMFNNPCKEYKFFQACCLFCWLIPMQFSLTLWNVILFWLYFGLYLYDDKCKRCEIGSISSNI